MSSRAHQPAPFHLLVLLFTIYVLQETLGEPCNATSSPRLDALLALYDREVLPPAAVVAEIALDIRHASIDDIAATMHVLGDLRLSWRDDRLSWNETDWGCDITQLSVERIWLPDVSLVTAGGIHSREPLRASVGSAGDVTWLSRLDVTLPVALNVYYWPADEQTTILEFASRTHAVDELDLKISQYQTAAMFESGAWEPVSVTGDQGLHEGVRAVTWSVAVRRRGAATLRARRGVLLAAVAMLLAAVVVPPQQRHALAAAAAFTAALWLTSSMSRVPAGAGAPLCVSVMCGVACCAAAIAAGAALTCRLAAVAAPPPNTLRSLVVAAGKVIALCPQEGASAESGTWAAAARLCDLVLLGAVTVALLVLLVLGLCL